MLSIYQTTFLPPQLAELAQEASAEGFRFVGRLMDDWLDGSNRFDQPGECLLVATVDGRLVGVGGVNIDPYVADGETARLRRLYVANAYRRRGIGEALVLALLQRATPHFRQIRLTTDTEAAADFYVQLGFEAVEDETATHVKWLVKPF